MLSKPNLLIKSRNAGAPSALVNTSASCKLVLTWKVLIMPACIFSLIKWQSTSICFVLSWNTGLAAMCKAALLSQ